MPRKAPAITPEVEITPEVSNLLEFWKEIVKGRVVTSDDQGAVKEIVVPLEVRIRASELLAKYMIPTKGKLVEAENEDTKVATPDILRVAQMLESDGHDDLLSRAFNMVRARKTNG